MTDLRSDEVEILTREPRRISMRPEAIAERQRAYKNNCIKIDRRKYPKLFGCPRFAKGMEFDQPSPTLLAWKRSPARFGVIKIEPHVMGLVIRFESLADMVQFERDFIDVA
jgi:hypothetical protein